MRDQNQEIEDSYPSCMTNYLQSPLPNPRYPPGQRYVWLSDANSQPEPFPPQTVIGDPSRAGNSLVTKQPFGLILIPQTPYEKRSREEFEPGSIFFFHNNNPGFNLADGVKENFHSLRDRDLPVFVDSGTSISLRLNFQLPGFSAGTKQIKTRNWRSPPSPIPLSKLAQEIGKFVQKYIDGTTINGENIVLDDMFITSLTRVGKASWQPELLLRVYQARK